MDVSVALYLLVMSFLSRLQEFRFHSGYEVCLNVHLSKLGTIIHDFIVLGLFFIQAVTIFSYRKVYKKIREHNKGAGQALHTQVGNTAISSHEIVLNGQIPVCCRFCVHVVLATSMGYRHLVSLPCCGEHAT